MEAQVISSIEWHKCEDKMPKDGSEVLVRKHTEQGAIYRFRASGYSKAEGSWEGASGSRYLSDPSHEWRYP